MKNSGDKLRYYNGSCLKHQGVINPEKCILRFLKQVSEVNSIKEVNGVMHPQSTKIVNGIKLMAAK